MSTHHVKVAIGMAVIVAAIAYLLLSGTTASTMYFLTVPEVQQQLSALQQASRPIRVAGQVTEDPIQWEARHLSLAFRIGEGEARLPVQYTGVKPDMFRAGTSVIVEGRIGRDGVLKASILMTSCPSKYQDEKNASS
jgi:cytochrome c-type biogenesis protein CcmE